MKDVQWDAHSEDGDANSYFKESYWVFFSLHPVNISVLEYLVAGFGKGGGRKCEKLRGKKKNQSVDEVVQHSAA